MTNLNLNHTSNIKNEQSSHENHSEKYRSSYSVSILKEQFQNIKLRNPSYSLRSFAQRLGLSSGALSELLSGKRDLSIKQKMKIVDKLDLSPDERRRFLSEQLQSHLTVRQEEAYQLTEDEFHLISDWWHFALLNLISTKNFKNNLKWFSQRLGLSVDIVRQAWERLIRLGHLKKDTKGKIIRKHPKFKTTEDVVNLSLRRSHIKDLELIEDRLLNTPIEFRHTSSMTFAVKRNDIDKIKKAITKFHQEIIYLYNSDEGDEVYRMSVSLFPLTKIDGGKVK